MADYIPFVNNEADSAIARKYFADAHCMRVTLESIETTVPLLEAGTLLWVDATVDAYDCILGTTWPMDISTESAEAIETQWPLDEQGARQDDWKYELWKRWHGLFGRFTGYRVLANKDVARDQLAAFYKEWFDGIAVTPPNERSLRLYEDLSRAYILARRLPQIPKGVLSADGSVSVREPGKVAEQLMLVSL